MCETEEKKEEKKGQEEEEEAADVCRAVEIYCLDRWCGGQGQLEHLHPFILAVAASVTICPSLTGLFVSL